MALGRVNVSPTGQITPITGGTDLNPSPKTYDPAYGGIPGAVPKPPSVYESLKSIYPGLQNLVGGAGNIISKQQAGELSPGTLKSIQDAAAAFGITTGMPLSQFQGYKGLRNVGIASEQQQQAGIDNAFKMIANLAGTVDNPSLLAEIAAANANRAAAPDPRAAAQEAIRLYNEQQARAASAAQPKSIGGLAPIAPSPGGGTRPTLGSSYDAPPAVYSNPAGGTTYGGATYYGGNPQTAQANWNKWASSLPDPYAGSVWAGATPSWEAYTSPGEPGGSWDNINLGDFTPAGGGPLNFGDIYNAAGLDYTDWNAVPGIDWSIYE